MSSSVISAWGILSWKLPLSCSFCFIKLIPTFTHVLGLRSHEWIFLRKQLLSQASFILGKPQLAQAWGTVGPQWAFSEFFALRSYKHENRLCGKKCWRKLRVQAAVMRCKTTQCPAGGPTAGEKGDPFLRSATYWHWTSYLISLSLSVLIYKVVFNTPSSHLVYVLVICLINLSFPPSTLLYDEYLSELSMA